MSESVFEYHTLMVTQRAGVVGPNRGQSREQKICEQVQRGSGRLEGFPKLIAEVRGRQPGTPHDAAKVVLHCYVVVIVDQKYEFRSAEKVVLHCKTYRGLTNQLTITVDVRQQFRGSSIQRLSVKESQYGVQRSSRNVCTPTLL